MCFSLFGSWYEKSTAYDTTQKAKEAIESTKQYYAFVINGVSTCTKFAYKFYALHIMIQSIVYQEQNHFYTQIRPVLMMHHHDVFTSWLDQR